MLPFHVVTDFLHWTLVGAVQHHFELTFFNLHHHRLLTHPAHHVERRVLLAPQRQLQNVRLDALLDRHTQWLLDAEEPVGRAQTIETLMRALVVVILHPQAHALPRLLEGGELGAAEELIPDRFPEPLDFAQRHRVMRLAADVVDVVLLEFLLEPRLAPPRGVLPPVVGQHFLGHAVVGHGAAIDFQHVLAGLAVEQLQPDQIARVVIHEADQVGLLAADADGADIALPQLHRRRPLKEPRFGRITFPLRLGLGHQLVLVQRLPHRLRAGRQEQHAPQPLGDAQDAELRLLGLQAHDGLLHGDCARARRRAPSIGL